jgi:alkylation response protein AidB-like acyl-CoA dehydrogenase
VGAENDGWRVAMVTFSFERGTAFTSDVISCAQDLRDLADIARKVLRKGSPAWDDMEIRREIGRLQADYDAMWALTKRNVSQAQRTGIVGPGGSVFKLFLADVQKRATELAYRLLGRMTTAFGDLGEMTEVDFVADRVYALTLSIAAGTSQIQRNIIGERVLGLPKER